MAKTAYRKFSKEEQKALATWAAACAERVLHFFEQERPQDDRPRLALEVCRKWVRTGEFHMAEIRGASLAAHAAARAVLENKAQEKERQEHRAQGNEAALFAARAAGQAVATAHVAQHAYGAALYALKAIAAAHPADAETKVTEERAWQSQRLAEGLPDALCQEMMARIAIEKKRRGLQIKLDKSDGF